MGVRRTKRIGLLGGTFDPIHRGHIQMIEAAKGALHLDRIYLVPAYKNPLKEKSQLAGRHRIQMIRIALKGLDYTRLSHFELKRHRVTYTIDAVRYFRRRLGAGTEIFFLCGADAVHDFRRWKRFSELLKICRFAVAPRRLFPWRKRKEYGRIFLLKMKPTRISSTEIRGRIRAGKRVRRFLPKGVMNYIYQKGLYQNMTEQ